MSNISFGSYLTGAILHLALAAFVLYSWGTRPGARQFLFTIVANALWAGVLALYAGPERLEEYVLVVVAELLRMTLWVVLVWRFLFGDDRRTWPRTTAYYVHGTWLAVLVFNAVVLVSATMNRPLVSTTSSYLISMFILSIVGYLLVYQFYRNSSVDQRWQVKFFCLGVGSLFVYDLFVFSLGVLFRGLASDLWDARGVVNGVVAILLAVSVNRMRTPSSEVAVSRNVVFYSTGMLGVGLYLIAIALGGYFIQVVGGDWGTFALIVFLFIALMLLFVVLFSGQARARLRVFLDKNFFHYRYDYRREWLNLTESLSEQDDDETLPLRALRAVSKIVQSPGATLWQLGPTGYSVKEAWNMSDYAGSLERADDPFCQFIRSREWIIDRDEYVREPEKYGRLVLPAWFSNDANAWLVIPLMHNEELTGFMVVARSMAMRELTWEDRDLLKSVGRQVASHLALHESAQELAQTRQFEAYNRLVAFLMHDLKNLIAQQSLVVRNAAKHKDNPEFIDDAIATVDNSVNRMNRILDQLRRGDQGGDIRVFDVTKMCSHVIEQTAERKPVTELVIEKSEIRVKADRERMTMVMIHLVRNAQDATEFDGSVTLFVGADSNRAIIEVRDTGSGMTSEFIRDRLFIPFDTTKGVKGMGIGVYQAREFVHSSGGEMQVDSQMGRGSTFRLLIPLASST
ncbi:MAG: XrtA/PEP-CTERM system histidine kinase PrsK [Gammaproteobacteria bacterium]